MKCFNQTKVLCKEEHNGQGGQTSVLNYLCRILLICIFIISCKSNKIEKSGEEGLNPVYVTNSKKIELLAPTAKSVPLDQVQLLNGRFGKQEFSLIVYFVLNDDGIFISLLNDFGTDMGSAFFDGKNVQFESSIFPKNMKAEYIIADIQNAYYKSEALKRNYEKAGLVFEEIQVDRGDRPHVIRIIKDGKKIIEQITIFENSIRIVNNLRGYEYNLTASDME